MSLYPQIFQEYLVSLTRYDQISISTSKKEYSHKVYYSTSVADLSRHVCFCLFSHNLSELKRILEETGGPMTMALPFRQKAMVKTPCAGESLLSMGLPRLVSSSCLSPYVPGSAPHPGHWTLNTGHWTLDTEH